MNGRLVREINYKKGLPVLESFALPGNAASIVLTGDHKADIRNAKNAWRKLNPGKTLPENATFHHDLLHVAEETVEINGKKTKVLVGKMHLVPTELHQTVFHEGSASVAKKFYSGLGTDVAAVKPLGSQRSASGRQSWHRSGSRGKKDYSQHADQGHNPFVGRGVRRAIPIVGTGLALLEFSENVKAHGVVGAVARATPVLGDLISVHDLGTELAKQIVDEANEKENANLREINEPVSKAWDQATQQTIDAFNELAPQIQVTNIYGPDGLVDPGEIKDALRIYRDDMEQANLLRARQVKDFDFDAAAGAQQARTQRASDASLPEEWTATTQPVHVMKSQVVRCIRCRFSNCCKTAKILP